MGPVVLFSFRKRDHAPDPGRLHKDRRLDQPAGALIGCELRSHKAHVMFSNQEEEDKWLTKPFLIFNVT